jgi:hypothetical protein
MDMNVGRVTMKTLRALLLLTAATAAPVSLGAQDSNALLAQAQTIRCFFQTGHMFEWIDRAARARPTEIDDTPVIFDRIDRDAGRARLIAMSPAGPQLTDVAVVVFDTGLIRGRSTYGLTFLEVSSAGSVNITTVWSPADSQSIPAQPGSYPAAYSHHNALDRPFPAQFPGWCRVEG